MLISRGAQYDATLNQTPGLNYLTPLQNTPPCGAKPKCPHLQFTVWRYYCIPQTGFRVPF